MAGGQPSGIARRLAEPIDRVARYRPPAVILLLGCGVVTISLGQAVLDPERVTVQLFEIGIPAMLAFPLFYTAVRIHGAERARERQYWSLAMGVLFAVIASGTVAFIVISEVAEGTRFGELLFPLLTSSTAGLSVGSLAGLNYDDVVATRADLEAEVARTRRLNQRLTVINRILRHNVRNTLTLALWLLDDVLDRVADPDIADTARRCRETLTGLHAHAEKALDVDRLWDPDVETVTVDLGSMLETAIERARSQAPTATFRTDLPEDVGVRVHPLVPVAIEEALENAIEHNDPATLTVEIRVDRGSDAVALEIADNGRGIPASELDPLDLDEETPLEHTSGVGLWLIKWVGEASGGEGVIRSNDRGGTTVRFRLPHA